MLTAWGCASAFGPLLIAHLREVDGTYRGALHIIAAVMAVSVILPLVVSRPKVQGIETINRQGKAPAVA